MLEIKQGVVTDFDALAAVFNEVAERIRQTGSSQWAHVLAGEEQPYLRERLQAGDVYCVRVGGKLAGVFYLTTETTAWDEELWRNVPTEGPTYYLHKLAIRNAFTGQQLGARVLTALQTQCQARNHVLSIRLDCLASQPYLNQLYKGCGFTYVKTIKGQRSGSLVADFNLYQWPEV